MGIYGDYLNANYKDEVIDMIKADVKDKIKDMPEEEFNHFCNNVFTVATLVPNDVKDQDIADEVMDLNNKFLSQCKEKGIEINQNTTEEQLELSSILSEKYIKVITDINNRVK